MNFYLFGPNAPVPNEKTEVNNSEEYKVEDEELFVMKMYSVLNIFVFPDKKWWLFNTDQLKCDDYVQTS